MSERDRLIESVVASGGLRHEIEDPHAAHLAVVGHRAVAARTVDGLTVDAVESDDDITVRVRLAPGVKLDHPVCLCFGLLGAEGRQHVTMDVGLGKGSEAHVKAHCVFPGAERVTHAMDATVRLDEGARMRYDEVHLHGPGGVDVEARAKITLGTGARYITDFSLLEGRVGHLVIDFDVDAGERAIAEMSARVYAHGDDRVEIRERVALAGPGARSLIRSRIALDGDAEAVVTGITEGNAPGARGHVDCTEIVRERAVARAVPLVSVSHPGAKVTHEAAIGSVDQAQLDTLMSRGLSPERAVDVIVKGILG